MTRVSEPAAGAGNLRRARVSGAACGAFQNRMPENAMKPSDIKPTVMKVMPRP